MARYEHTIACLHGGMGGSRLAGTRAGHAQAATDRGALFVSETWQKHRSARGGRSSTLMSSWTVCSLPLSGSAVHPPPPLLCRAYPVLHPLRIGMHMHQHTQLQVSGRNSYSSSSSTHKQRSDHCYPRPLTPALPLTPLLQPPLPPLCYYTTTSLSPGPPTNCHYVYCPTVNNKYMPPLSTPPHLPLPLILLATCHRWTTTILLPLSCPPPTPAAHHQHPVPIVSTYPARSHLPTTDNTYDTAPAPSNQTALQQPQRPADNTKERQVSAVLRASSGYRGSDTALLVLTS